MLKSFLSFLQVVVPIFLIVLVTAQNRSAGLGAMFGGDGGFHVSKRGPEKVLHQATIVTVVLFFAVTLLSAFFA